MKRTNLERITGEPDEVKVSRPVRWGVVTKVLLAMEEYRQAVTRRQPTRCINDSWRRRGLTIIGCGILGGGLLFLFADPLAQFLATTFGSGAAPAPRA